MTVFIWLHLYIYMELVYVTEVTTKKLLFQVSTVKFILIRSKGYAHAHNVKGWKIMTVYTGIVVLLSSVAFASGDAISCTAVGWSVPEPPSGFTLLQVNVVIRLVLHVAARSESHFSNFFQPYRRHPCGATYLIATCTRGAYTDVHDTGMATARRCLGSHAGPRTLQSGTAT